jgi:hypothetical protein
MLPFFADALSGESACFLFATARGRGSILRSKKIEIASKLLSFCSGSRKEEAEKLDEPYMTFRVQWLIKVSRYQ